MVQRNHCSSTKMIFFLFAVLRDADKTEYVSVNSGCHNPPVFTVLMIFVVLPRVHLSTKVACFVSRRSGRRNKFCSNYFCLAAVSYGTCHQHMVLCWSRCVQLVSAAGCGKAISLRNPEEMKRYNRRNKLRSLYINYIIARRSPVRLRYCFGSTIQVSRVSLHKSYSMFT